MKKALVLLALPLAAAAATAVPVAVDAAHPETITNCWTWKSGRNYWGDCNGTGYYQSYAYCVAFNVTKLDYGSIETNGNVSSGQCQSGYTANAVYVRIL